MRSFFKAAAVAAVAFGVCAGAFAQDYPTRTITLVVPYPPGGGVDAMARVVAEKLAVAQVELALLQPLYLQQVGARRVLQS